MNRRYLLTAPWIPVIHFFGLNDTGSLFALEWWMHFPDEGAGGKCNKEPAACRQDVDYDWVGLGVLFWEGSCTRLGCCQAWLPPVSSLC